MDIAPQGIPRVCRSLDAAKEHLLAASVMYWKCIDEGYDADASGVSNELIVAAWNYSVAFAVQNTSSALQYRDMDIHEFARLQGWSIDAFPEPPPPSAISSLVDSLLMSIPTLVATLKNTTTGPIAEGPLPDFSHAPGFTAPTEVEETAFGPLVEGVMRLRAEVHDGHLGATDAAKKINSAILWAKAKKLAVPALEKLTGDDATQANITMLVDMILMGPSDARPEKFGGADADEFIASASAELWKLTQTDKTEPKGEDA